MALLLGELRFDDAPVNARRLRAALSRHARWGRGGPDVWEGRRVVLGHVAEAPIEREGDCTVLFDGRLDGVAMNRGASELRKAWREWRADFPERLEGDFTAALFDEDRGVLTLVRSPFVCAPLFLHLGSDALHFSTRIEPLLALSGHGKRLNLMALARPPADEEHGLQATAFEGVSALRPAVALEVSPDGSLRHRVWWEPRIDVDPPSESHDDMIALLRERIVSAVENRMPESESVCSLLSGGLDSSTITCIAADSIRKRGGRLEAVSSALPEGWRGPERDERRFIEIVAREKPIDVTYLHPSASLLDFSTTHFEMMAAPAIHPKHYVFQAFVDLAKSRGHGIILDGIGGECGPSARMEGVLSHLFRPGSLGLLWRELFDLSRWTGRSPVHLMLTQVLFPPHGRLRSWFRSMASSPRSDGSPFTRELRQELGLDEARRSDVELLPRAPEPKEVLAKVVRAVMMRSALIYPDGGPRILHPFLDRRLIETCLTFRPHWFRRHGWSRSPIRCAMEGILPEAIRHRACKGPFSPDYFRRLQAALPLFREFFEAVPRGGTARRVYDFDRVLRVIDRLGRVGGAETSPEGLEGKMSVQRVHAGVRFIEWFEKLDVEIEEDEE